jgi:hypothetical protein
MPTFQAFFNVRGLGKYNRGVADCRELTNPGTDHENQFALLCFRQQKEPVNVVGKIQFWSVA